MISYHYGYFSKGNDPMPFLRNAIVTSSIFIAGMTVADTVSYGSLQYHSESPNVLFLIGEIKKGDSFELRRAMRDQTINLVVTASPGGNLYEGLQIAAILHDNKIGTYIPEAASCESSCANIFLGGSNRMLVGELGVHQFYSGGSDANNSASKSDTTAATQYTTSDIIGIMNQFDTPPFVYEKMFGTQGIYYFSGYQKSLLNKGLDDAEFIERLDVLDVFLAQAPIIQRRTLPSMESTGVAKAPTPIAPVRGLETSTMAESAIAVLASINADWSLPNELAMSRLAYYYATNVDFYGNTLSHAGVMAEKEAFAKRWPIRSYAVEPESVRVNCSAQGCIVESIITWAAASPQRGAKASGRSTWELLLVLSGGTLKIASESGKTFKRN